MEFRYDPFARRFRIRTLVPAGQPERVFTVDDQFQFGIEEEYFLCDAQTLQAPTETPDALFKRANFGVTGNIGREFLQAQIEVATEPHTNASDARRELLRLRQNAAAAAAEHGLSIAACSTHPMAHWREAVQSPKDRYATVMDALQMIGQRNMLCGMHVHVEFPDPARRVDVMTRMLPYIPLFIALSASSPFWQGHATGLKGYRLAAYDELPRTGLPELFRNNAEYDAYVDAMVLSGAMQDASHLWWAVRPSLKYPTLELRAPDCCTRLDDSLALASLYRSAGALLVWPSGAQCGAGRGRSGDCGRKQMAGAALWRAGHLCHPVGRCCRSAIWSCMCLIWSGPTPRRWAVPASSTTAARSSPRAPRLTLSYGFLQKMNTKVPRLRYKR